MDDGGSRANWPRAGEDLDDELEPGRTPFLRSSQYR